METRIPLLSLDEQLLLLGSYDRHVKEVDRRLEVRMSVRNGALKLQGPEEAVRSLAARVETILKEVRRGDRELAGLEVEARLIGDVGPAPKDSARPRPAEGGMPEPRTAAQAAYMDAMRDSELVLAAGPAGTGKTFLAVASAVRHLQAGRVQRLILTRPAVEAGEHLGFLPGDYEAKVDPYLRPLNDSLLDILGPTGLRRLRSLDLVEIAPLAFMRGRTLARSFIILDEAQNCTSAQMKMFLTRIGEGSRAVVTGDLTQSDLGEQENGFAEAMERLRILQEVKVVELGTGDIQRSGIVQRVVQAYQE